MYNENYDDEILEKIAIMLDRINMIYKICDACGSAKEALQDELLTQPAIMKHFDIMHEQILKISKKEMSKELFDNISEVHLIGLRDTRNFSAHNYSRLDFKLIHKTIINELPKLESELKNILMAFDSDDIDEYIEQKYNIRQLDTKIQIYETIVNRLKARRNELQNEPSADSPDDDTPHPPSQGQGTRHKR